MRCSVCGHENADDAKFCAQCGSSLAATCPVCNHGVGPEDRFCSNCGAALAAEPAASEDHDLARYVPDALLRKIRAVRAGGTMRGERRTVTMLFADIEGSTAAAEHLDPEEWADIVNGAFEHLIAPVYRYEGTLARLQGDAILAFFGAPIAHEDDPVRAVRAGLEMLGSIRGYAEDVRRRTGVPIAVRVGINTGLVVVGEVGSDLRVEYTALGDAINVAARMEQTADPDTVRITETTAALLGDAADLTPIGPVEVKGRAEPVTALRVDGLAIDHRHEEVVGPVVGRDRERATLAQVVERVAAGIGGVATVVGEPGIGKSRLLAAMRQDAESALSVAATTGAPGDIAWLEGHSRSFDTAVPYAPFLDLAARWHELVGLAPESVYDRIAADLARALGEPDPDRAAYLTQVLGAPLPAEADALVSSLETPVLHERTTESIVSYLEAEAARRPLVIVLDDLHWADALSLSMAERLMAAAERAPIALVLSLRPVREEAAWRLVETAAREAAHRHTAVELDALDPSAADALLDLLLAERSLTDEDRRRILERADGNPLFVEELVGAVGGDGAVLPTSLSGLLTARLDRLEEDERLVAQVAAVAGAEFEADAVDSLLDEVAVPVALGRLVRHGVLVERRRLPRPLFAFRHALIQEAAYDTVLLKDRRRLHGRLAHYLEQERPDAPHEIAHHHLESGTPSAAFPWLVEAGNRAMRAMSLADAIRLYTTALDNATADADPDEVARVHLGLGEAYSLVPDLDQASAAYQSLVDLGRTTGRPSLQVQALNRLGFNAAALGADFTTANEYLETARSLAEEAGDELGLAECHMNSCFVAVAQGELDRAIEHDAETARLGETIGADKIRVVGLVRRASNLLAATKFDEVDDALRDARTAAEEIGSEELLAVLTGLVEAAMRQRAGDLEAALELMTDSARTLERYGSFYTPIVQVDAGRVALRLGKVETALGRLADVIRTAEAKGPPFVVSGAAAGLALGYAICGDEETSAHHRARALEALQLPVGEYMASSVWADLGDANLERGVWDEAEADFAVGLQASSTTRFWERPRLLAGAARAALEGGDTARARELCDDAVAYAEERGMRMFAPSLGTVSARIARAEGRPDAAEAQLAAADEEATRMGMRPLAVHLAALRGEIADTTGRSEDAATHRERRARIVAELTSEVVDPELREQLAARYETTGARRT